MGSNVSNNLSEEVSKLEEQLRGFESRKENLLSSLDDKIKAIVCIMGLFTFLGFVNLDIILSVQLRYLLEQILLVSDLYATYISIGMMILSIPTIGIIDVLTFRKVLKTMRRKSQDKIMSSQEYIDLVRNISETEQLLETKLSDKNRQMPSVPVEDAQKRISVVLRKFGFTVSDGVDLDDEQPAGPKQYVRTRRIDGKRRSTE